MAAKSENRIITQKEVDNLNQGRKRVNDLMMLHRDQIVTALPSFIKPERAMGIVLTAMTRNPDLLNCTQVSIISAALTCFSIGLMPDGILGEAFLVPFKNNSKNTLECQVIIGYKGLTNLAMRSGLVSSVRPFAVYAANEEGGDFFDYDMGLNEKLEHKRSGLDDPDRITHFYAIVRYLNGGHTFHVMTRAEVEKVRNESPNYKHAKNIKNTFWFKHFAKMGMKTCLRELLRHVPLSSELSQAIALDELNDAGVKQNNALTFLGDLKVDAEDVAHEVLEDHKAAKEEILDNKKEQTKQKSAAVTDSTIQAINKKTVFKKAPNAKPKPKPAAAKKPAASSNTKPV